MNNDVKNCYKCAHCDGFGFCHHWNFNVDEFDDGFVRCCEYKEKERRCGMNNDLISREVLVKWIDDSVSQYGYTYSNDMLNMWGLFKDYLINNAPTVEPKQGEWKEFAEFVAKEVCTDNFKDNSDSFAELACRRLVKLGLLKLDGDTYKKGGAE